jgi:hypothetical protein
MKSAILNLLEISGPVQASAGIALLLAPMFRLLLLQNKLKAL